MSEIHDVPVSSVTAEFFESVCLASNRPCIVRCESTHSSCCDVAPLCRALAAVELMSLNSAASAENEHARKLCSSEVESIARSGIDLKNLEVKVEVKPREYEFMSLSAFLAENRGLFTQLLLLQQQEEREQEPKSSATPAASTSSSSSLYLKDWHFQELWAKITAKSESDQLYILPDFMRKFAQDDILQRFQRHAQRQESQKQSQEQEQEQEQHASSLLPSKFGPGEEYRFVYAGGAGSCTKPHFDVCATYSFSVNLSGVKRWRFARDAVCNEQLLGEYFLRKSKQTTAAAAASLESLQCEATRERVVEIIQKPGDLVFVPALWVHEVENLTRCVSMNHNWYALPYSLPHIMRLLEHETSTMIAMTGKETIDALGAEDWPRILNLSMVGSSAWSPSVVTRLLEFALTTTQQENEGTSSCCQAEIEKVLLRLDALDKELF